MGRIGWMLGVAAAAAAFGAPALAQESQELHGIIVKSGEGVVTVKLPSGDQDIRLAPDVRIRSISGALGGQKEEMPVTSLVPGLAVEIEATGTGADMVATEIDFKEKDYKTAAQIQAGTQENVRAAEETARAQAETARREAQLRAAYEKVGQWDLRGETSVFFKTGSAVISPEGKAELKKLAGQAKAYNGYVISVLGYADPRGNAAANEALSNKRAQAVINYIKQSGEVLPGRVLAASAMGEIQVNGATAPADEKAQHALSRRVTVRILTSAAQLPPQ